MHNNSSSHETQSLISTLCKSNKKLMAKRNKKTDNPKVHDDLKGFKVEINEFGEIISNMDVEKLNEFLDEKVEDKKLVDRKDLKK